MILYVEGSVDREVHATADQEVGATLYQQARYSSRLEQRIRKGFE
jgi:hypothetical protein